MGNETKRRGVERILRHDGRIVVAATTLIILIATWYTVAGVGMNMSALDMTRMAGPLGEPMEMGARPPWSLSHAVLIFLMWWIMMIAMMTPSAAPMLLLYSALKRRGSGADEAALHSLLFLSGYLLMWAAFSIGAAGVQWATESLELTNGPMMTIKSRGFAGAVMIVAGLYQFSSLKSACLKFCRSPAHFLARYSRPGALGAFRTGARHGVYCLGCCWALMALLFVGGIMNLYWIAGIAVYVLVEKIVPHGPLFARLTGAGLIGSGLFLLAA